MNELKTGSCLSSLLYYTTLGPLYLLIDLLFSKVYFTGTLLSVLFGMFFFDNKKDYFLFDDDLCLRQRPMILHAQFNFIADKRSKWVSR